MTIRDDKLVHEILLNGGITLDVKTNRTIEHTTGYMVALEGCEKQVAVPELNLTELTKYIDEHLTLLNNPEYFFGAWVNDGIVYLDVSVHSTKLEYAKWLGKLEDQIAIYDLENNCEIVL